MRRIAKLGCLGIVLSVLAVAVAGADDRGATSSPWGCPFSSQKVVYPPGTTTTFRFWKVGVSCPKVGRLFAAFWRHARAGQCEGSRCIVTLPGGWACSGFSAPESAENQGAESGCYKGPKVKFRAYPVLRTRGFLSPDRKIWCFASPLSAVDDRELGCVSKPAPGHLSGVGAVLGTKGPPRLCEELTAEELEPGHPPPWDCFQNFDRGAPVLSAGSSVEDGGFRCTSNGGQITCTYGEGSSRRGFVISQTTVAAV